MRLLLVEDSPSERQILKYLLTEQFKEEKVVYHEASTLAEAAVTLDRELVDCVVLDLQLPDSVGRDTFQRIHGQFPNIPIIVMTNNKDRALALEMIQNGADDFVVKNYTDEEDIFRRIVFAVEKHKRSVRMQPEKAASYRRVSDAKLKMVRAQEDGGSPSTVRNMQIETTSAVADLASKMFSELQTLNIQMSTLSTQQKTVFETVQTLDKELLRGHSNRPSMRSQVDRLDFRVESLEKDFVEIEKEVDEADQTQRREVLDLHKTKMSLRVKILIAVFGLMGVIATAVGGYYAATHKPATKATSTASAK
jgi:DNA-binding response OmpR family regulator